MEELDHYKTSYESLGGTNYRIFVEHGVAKFSLVIQCAQAPSELETVQFFIKNHKHFDIET